MAGPTDPRWPKLVSLTVHEFRSPLTVVGGYIRMLLKERAGPLSDQQRKLLEEAEKSCGRLSALIAELSELGHHEGGTAAYNRSTVDVRAVLASVIAALPENDRPVAIELQGDASAPVHGDATRLTAAFTAILLALRRELVTSDNLAVVVRQDKHDGADRFIIGIADPDRVESLLAASPSALTTFDEWRGGNGLALANARRILEAHGGRLFGPDGPAEESRAAALVTLPRAEK